MKAFRLIFLLASLLTVQAGFAEEALQSSRSVGKLKADQLVDLTRELKKQAAVIRAKPTQAENYDASAEANAQPGVANRHDQLFEIYAADVDLIAVGPGHHDRGQRS